MKKLFEYAGTSLVRTSVTAEEYRAGCSNRPSSKAAASEEARRTLRYVELLSEARTKLADCFSILLQRRRGFSGDKGSEQYLVRDLGETRTVHAKIGEHLLQIGD